MGLSGKIRNIRLARRVQQDGLAGFSGHLEYRQESRFVEAGAIHVCVELQSVGIAFEQDAFGFLDRGVGCVHRKGADVPSESIRVFRNQFSQAVISDARNLWRPIEADHVFERRQSQRKDLRVVVKLVHHAKARIEIIDRANTLHALADVCGAADGLRHDSKYPRRKEMTKSIDVAHECKTPCRSGSDASVMKTSEPRHPSVTHCAGLSPMSFAIAAVRARNSSIDAVMSALLPGLTTKPAVAANRSRITGSAATVRTSAVMRSRNSTGMSRGPNMPTTSSNVSSGNPASVTVGMPGARSERWRLVSAIILTRPFWTCGLNTAIADSMI